MDSTAVLSVKLLVSAARLPNEAHFQSKSIDSASTGAHRFVSGHAASVLVNGHHENICNHEHDVHHLYE